MTKAILKKMAPWAALGVVGVYSAVHLKEPATTVAGLALLMLAVLAVVWVEARREFSKRQSQP